MARLTVILCNYNHAHYLPTALDAITGQSRPPDQLIVIDDASVDNSREVIAQYAKRFSFLIPIFNETNRGVIPNANHGLDLASGNYVFFASADDRVLPEFFADAMRAAEAHPGIGAITTDPVWFDDLTGAAWVTPLPLGGRARAYSGADLAAAQRQVSFMLPGHATILNRKAILDAGGLLPSLKWYCDWFMNLVAAYRQGLYYVPEPRSALRAVAGSYSTGSSRSTEQIDVLRQIGFLLTNPRYADVGDPVKHSAILADFGWPLVRAFAPHAVLRHFLTRRVLFRIIRGETRKRLRLVLPRGAKEFFHGARGSRLPYRDIC